SLSVDLARSCATIADTLYCTLCFFLQAEDGIRDFHVTGVQTCALPISCRRSGCSACAAFTSIHRGWPGRHQPRCPLSYTAGLARSEERRVGKECSSRWGP